MNSLIEAIVTGVLQGALEWLPISSEGNLVILLSQLFRFNAEDTLNTAIFLHLGTALAAIIYFRKKVLSILMWSTPKEKDLFIKLFIMTMLTGVVGAPIFIYLIISTSLGELLLAITGIALIATGILQREVNEATQSEAELTWPLSIILGIAQGLAIIPGISRSGLTTAILLFSGFDGEKAFKTSFLMSIPASIAASLGLILMGEVKLEYYLGLATIVAAITGYITIDQLLKVARKVNLWKICVGLGILALLAWLPNLL